MGLKAWLVDFPTANGRVVATICLIGLTGLVVCVRLFLGADFPNGYDTWIWALVVLAGVDSAHVVGKRLSDYRYKAAGNGTQKIDVSGDDAKVSVTTAAKPAALSAEPSREDDESGT